MTTYLFLHGGYHGAWCWQPIISELQKLGHKAYALDLPGAGEDLSERGKITSKTYIEAVSHFIMDQDLNDITLVGHSLAGVIMPSVWEANRDRITELVYIAAIVLNAGERAIDFIPEDRKARYFELAEKSGNNTVMWDFDKAWKTWFHNFSETEANKYYQLLTPQPLSIFTEEATVGAKSVSVPSHYILCTDDHALPENLCKEFAKKLGVSPIEIEAGHEVMLSDPERLAKVLLRG